MKQLVYYIKNSICYVGLISVIILAMNCRRIVAEPPCCIDAVPPIDTIMPVPGDNGKISAEDIDTDSLVLRWTKGLDNISWQINLDYEVYRSEADNLKTVEETQTNGTLVTTLKTDIDSAVADNLLPNTTYFFNVLMRDEAGNDTVYTTVEAVTMP